jgi:ATP-dependent 26S proteasome regulatory subunit
MSVAKGVLLYGPPGTGKTLLVRYLVGALPAHTRFLLSGDRLAYLSDTVEAARLLAPSLVVIEDVDLVAAHRDGPFQSTPAALNRLLNDMDGAGKEAQILFLLTTNRPEVLEPALAARPGRIDQAIEIGLPDEQGRRALLRLYTKRVPAGEGAIRHAGSRTGKVSPAFLKELARRAIQVMLVRGGSVLLAEDFEDALRDMLGARGKIPARLPGGTRVGFLSGD